MESKFGFTDEASITKNFENLLKVIKKFKTHLSGKRKEIKIKLKKKLKPTSNNNEQDWRNINKQN
jgi:hypothetical protein